MNSQAQLPNKNFLFYDHSSKAKFQKSSLKNQTMEQNTNISTASLPTLGKSMKSIHTKQASLNNSIEIIAAQQKLKTISTHKKIMDKQNQSSKRQTNFKNHYGTNIQSSPLGFGFQNKSESRLKSKSALADPNFILNQYNKCKNENIQRLEKVDRLEDLINFKVQTVADIFDQTKHGESIQLHDSIIENDDFQTYNHSLQQKDSTSILQHPYKSLQNQEQASIFQGNNGVSNNSTSDLQYMLNNQKIGMQVTAQNQSLNEGGIPLRYQNQNTINMLKSMCDPLLSKNIENWKPTATSKKQPGVSDQSKYEIPDELKKQPKQFNRYIPIKTLNAEPKDKEAVQEEATKSKEALLKEKVEKKIQEIEDKVKEESKQALDPIVMLKKYFDGRRSSNEAVKDNSQLFDPKSTLNQKIYSSNFVVAKYEKLKAKGQLRNFEMDSLLQDGSQSLIQEESIMSNLNARSNQYEIANEQSMTAENQQDFQNNLNNIQQMIQDQDDEQSIKQQNSQLEEPLRESMLNTANFAGPVVDSHDQGTDETLSRVISTADFNNQLIQDTDHAANNEPANQKHIQITVGDSQVLSAQESPLQSDQTTQQLQEIFTSQDESTINQQSMASIENQLDKVGNSRKPRFSVLKQFQSIQSSNGDATYYVPYSKDQIELIKRFQIQRELQRSNSRTTSKLAKESHISSGTLNATVDKESLNQFKSNKDIKIVINPVESNHAYLTQAKKKTLIQNQTKKLQSNPSIIIPHKLDIKLKVKNEAKPTNQPQSNLKLPQEKSNLRVKLNRDLSGVRSSINSEVQKAKIVQNLNEDIHIHKIQLSHRELNGTKQTDQNSDKEVISTDILQSPLKLALLSSRPIANLMDQAVGQSKAITPMTLKENDSMQDSQHRYQQSNKNHYLKKQINDNNISTYQDQFMMISNYKTQNMKISVDQLPVSTNEIQISQREFPKSIYKQNQSDMIDSYQLVPQLNKSADTFKLQSEVEIKTEDNFIQNSFIHQLETGQTDRIMITVKDSNDNEILKPKLISQTKDVSKKTSSRQLEKSRKSKKSDKKSLVTVNSIMESVNISNKVDSTVKSKKNNDLNNVLSNQKSRKQTFLIKDSYMPSGSSTMKQQSVIQSVNNADAITLIGKSQQAEDSYRIQDLGSQKDYITIQKPHLVIREIKETKGDIEIDDTMNMSEEILINTNPNTSLEEFRMIKDLIVIPQPGETQPDEIQNNLQPADVDILVQAKHDASILDLHLSVLSSNEITKSIESQKMSQTQLDNIHQANQQNQEVIKEVIDQHFQKRDSWIPYRFKKFPRFGQQGNEKSNQIQEYNSNSQIEEEYFNLNPIKMTRLIQENEQNLQEYEVNYNQNQNKDKNLKQSYIHISNQNIQVATEDLEETLMNQEKSATAKIETELSERNPIQNSDLTQITNASPKQMKQLIAKIPSPRKGKNMGLNGARRLSSIDSLIESDSNILSHGRQSLDNPIQQFISQSQYSSHPHTSKLNQPILIIPTSIHNSPQKQEPEINYNKDKLVKNDKDQMKVPIPIHIYGLTILQDKNSNQKSNTSAYDPFQKVFISKQIDNQILTSNRTLLQQNNIFSETLKVVHKCFRAPDQVNKAIEKQILSQGKILYETDFQFGSTNQFEQTFDGTLQDQEFQQLQVNAFGNSQFQSTGLLSHNKNASLNDSVHFNVQLPVYDQGLQDGIDKILTEVTKNTELQNKNMTEQTKKTDFISTISKQKTYVQKETAPISIYDVSGGQDYEENGFGYMRSPFVLNKPPDDVTSKRTRNVDFNSHQLSKNEKQLLYGKLDKDNGQLNVQGKGFPTNQIHSNYEQNQKELNEKTNALNRDLLILNSTSSATDQKSKPMMKSPQLDLARLKSMQNLDNLVNMNNDTARQQTFSPFVSTFQSKKGEFEQHELIVQVKTPNKDLIQSFILEKKEELEQSVSFAKEEFEHEDAYNQNSQSIKEFVSTQNPSAIQSGQASVRQTVKIQIKNENEKNSEVGETFRHQINIPVSKMKVEKERLDTQSIMSIKKPISRGQSVQKSSMNTELTNTFATIDQQRFSKLDQSNSKFNSIYRYQPSPQMQMTKIDPSKIKSRQSAIKAKEKVIESDYQKLLKSEVTQRESQLKNYMQSDRVQSDMQNGDKTSHNKGSHAGMMSTVEMFMGSNEVWNKANLDKKPQSIQPNNIPSIGLQGKKIVDKDKKLNKIQVRVKNIQKKSQRGDQQEKPLNIEIQEALTKYQSEEQNDHSLKILNLLKKDNKQEVKSVISQIVKNEQKYERKVPARGELVQNNALIFDLSKLEMYPELNLIDQNHSFDNKEQPKKSITASGQMIQMNQSKEISQRKLLNKSPLRYKH